MARRRSRRNVIAGRRDRREDHTPNGSGFLHEERQPHRAHEKKGAAFVKPFNERQRNATEDGRLEYASDGGFERQALPPKARIVNWRPLYVPLMQLGVSKQ